MLSWPRVKVDFRKKACRVMTRGWTRKVLKGAVNANLATKASMVTPKLV